MWSEDAIPGSFPAARTRVSYQAMPSESLPAERPDSRRARLESIDVVRGVIMILMALDHTRDFFGIPGQNPTDLANATAALFLTRWITYFCAPVFFLLTGTGAYLSLRRKSPGELSRFLLTRGLWLIFLEVVVVRCFAYQFNVDYRVTMLLVLWALGWAMITLAALVRLPASVVTAFGVLLIAGHNLFDSREVGEPALVDPARAGFRPQHPGARRVRGLSAHSLDRRDRGGLRPRAGLRLGCRAPAGLPPAPGAGPEPGVPGDSRAQRLRRPVALDAAEDRAVHRALVPEHDQVPAVAAVPADDARTGADLSLGASIAARHASCGRRW